MNTTKQVFFMRTIFLDSARVTMSMSHNEADVTYASLLYYFSVVPVGEPSVMIAVSATHRKEAIEATSFAIDAVKSSTTIWKKVSGTTCTSTILMKSVYFNNVRVMFTVLYLYMYL